MYVMKDPSCERQFGLVVEDAADITVCQRALGPTAINYEKVLRLYRLEPPVLLDIETSGAVMRGLAYISLNYFGPQGYGRLTQEQADQRISTLLGGAGEAPEEQIGTLG